MARVTLKRIAEYTGLSKPTISQVLNNRGDLYRPETRAQVLKAAAELGYRPNGAARAVQDGRFGCVTLLSSVIPDRSFIPPQLLNSIYNALEASGLHMTFAQLPDTELTDTGFVPKLLRQWMSDGLIINYLHDIPARMLELIRQHRIPSVWTNAKLEKDVVYPDDLAGGRAATEHLLKLGHKRIAYIHHSDSRHYSAIDRRAGYESAMAEAGLEPAFVAAGRVLTAAERVAKGRTLLRGRGRPTACVTYGIRDALPLVRAAERAGLVLSRDLSVVTFNSEAALDVDLAIGTMVIPHGAIGEQAVAMLVSKLDDPTATHAPVPVPFVMAPGDTAAPPND